MEYDDSGAGTNGGSSESRGLLSDETVIEMGSSAGRRGSAARTEALPPKWVDLADKVDDIVDNVKPKSEHVMKLVGEVLPGS